MKIAIIGGGISGLTAAYVLHRDFDIEVFEMNSYIGGHTHTHSITRNARHFEVDSGFIVFNEVTYPNFCTMLKQLAVESQPTRMTFSVRCEKTGLEYNAHSLRTFFGQRRNLLSPSFHRMLFDIFRFRRQFEEILRAENDSRELGRYVREHGYSRAFIEHFLVPIGASLWSSDPKVFESFPLSTFARFFRNHGFLNVRNPFPWRVIRGGSRRYVEKIVALFPDRIRVACPVAAVRRAGDHVEVSTTQGLAGKYDQVIIAAHADQALAILEDATPLEKEILSAFPYKENLTTLHTDHGVLPRRRALWASWNYLIPKEPSDRVAVTYDMNILQTLDSAEEFCVTLNREGAISLDKVIKRMVYHHPVFTTVAPPAQKRHAEISGVDRIHFCGAYWGYGFHEDGVNSALAVCRWFGKGLA